MRLQNDLFVSLCAPFYLCDDQKVIVPVEHFSFISIWPVKLLIYEMAWLGMLEPSPTMRAGERESIEYVSGRRNESQLFSLSVYRSRYYCVQCSYAGCLMFATVCRVHEESSETNIIRLPVWFEGQQPNTRIRVNICHCYCAALSTHAFFVFVSFQLCIRWWPYVGRRCHRRLLASCVCVCKLLC